MDKVIHIHFLKVQHGSLQFDSHRYNLVCLMADAMELGLGGWLFELEMFHRGSWIFVLECDWEGIDRDLMMIFDHFVARRIKESHFDVIVMPFQIEEPKPTIETKLSILIQPSEPDIIIGSQPTQPTHDLKLLTKAMPLSPKRTSTILTISSTCLY